MQYTIFLSFQPLLDTDLMAESATNYRNFICPEEYFIFSSNTPTIISIKSTYKATCFGPIRPSSGLTIRTGSFTSSTFWDPKLFT